MSAWRAFLDSPEGRDGLAFLKSTQAPAVRGKDAAELLSAGLRWGGYIEALNDLSDVLTNIPVREKPTEEPSLNE